MAVQAGAHGIVDVAGGGGESSSSGVGSGHSPFSCKASFLNSVCSFLVVVALLVKGWFRFVSPGQSLNTHCWSL